MPRRSPSRRPFRRQGGHPSDDPSKVAAFTSEGWPPSPRNRWPPSRRNPWPPSLGIRNYHSLSDFRAEHGEYLDGVLTHSVAVLMEQGLVNLNRVSQDGTRVRASAGAASFRRHETLERCLLEAEEQIRLLRQELDRSSFRSHSVNIR
jgi:hypothetical protein